MQIKNKNLTIPLIQGGMGVGISLGHLAGHVAKKGGMGMISAAHPGYRRQDFMQDSWQSNLKGLDEEIQKAKAIAQGHGLVGVNIMVAINRYEEMVLQAVASGADIIISGAGLPLSLPQYTKGTPTAIAPIVSSARSAQLILKTWDRRYQVIPDLIIIEGPEAGGHLGFDKNDLLHHQTPSLESILQEVLAVIQPYQEKYQQNIPVFVAGGIYDGHDLKHFLDLGAAGAQIATRFIATYECDAAEAYKQMFVKCRQEDIQIVQSPVGMPGRAIRTPLIERLNQGEKIPLKHCFNCLKPCDPKTTPYCISMALIEAARGNLTEGLFFCGSNAWRIQKICHVFELIDEIMKECEEKS